MKGSTERPLGENADSPAAGTFASGNPSGGPCGDSSDSSEAPERRPLVPRQGGRAPSDSADTSEGTDTSDSAEKPAAAPVDAASGRGHPATPLPPALASAVADELVRRAEEDRELTREAGAAPTAQRRGRIVRCHRDNAEALAAIVGRHGWPAADVVGAQASTAALMILLHAPDLRFRLHCRDLIAQATADGRCPAVHLAYIADHCAVELGEPQFYGTRINPVTLRPYPVRRPQTLDERRRDVGLGPLEEQMRALRLQT